jgi:hypothetical protein
MMLVHHAGDTVETETIEHELVHPVAEVGEEESKDFWVPIVEEAGVPQVMASARTLVEVQVISSIKHVDAAGISWKSTYRAHPSRTFLQA